jgi:hypothetical protein
MLSFDALAAALAAVFFFFFFFFFFLEEDEVGCSPSPVPFAAESPKWTPRDATA